MNRKDVEELEMRIEITKKCNCELCKARVQTYKECIELFIPKNLQEFEELKVKKQ